MELNDNEFDATFRKKVFDAEPRFEEAAWDKMERKLKHRDRVVFFRKAALSLLVLLAGVWAFYSIDQKPPGKDVLTVNKKEKDLSRDKEPAGAGNKGRPASGTAVAPTVTVAQLTESAAANAMRSPGNRTAPIAGFQAGQSLHGHARLGIETKPFAGAVADTLSIAAIPVNQLIVRADQLKSDKKERQGSRRLPLSLAISAGPEFNSASTLVGGDPGFSAGLTLGFGISRKLDLQAGLRYSLKKYNSGANVRYNFPGMSAYAKNNFTGLDASCDVLEIPVQASYEIMNKGKASVQLNAGISSYLMLKEDYTLKYKTSYSQASYDLQKRNANRHILSIVDLSATYFIKVDHTNLKLGLEPFVKIPLTGVGEGNINLKSSGLSLKVRYDLDKKNN